MARNLAGTRSRVASVAAFCLFLIALIALIARPTSAAVIDVEGDCTLVDAINAANMDMATGGCAAGDGCDTIFLHADIVLTDFVEVDLGLNGLPVVRSCIDLEGRGFTVERAPDSLEFRIFTVAENGSLNVNETTIRNGSTALSVRGRATLSHSTISHGGVAASASSAGYVRITDSRMSHNTVGISVGIDGAVEVVRTTISDSTVGIYSLDGERLDVEQTTIMGCNTGIESRGDAPHVVTITNSTISENSTGVYAEYEGNIELFHCTVMGNGVGLLEYREEPEYDGDIVSINSVVAGNGTDCDPPRGSSQGHNFDSDGTCGFDPIVPVDIDINLADNGGPTLTHALFEDSVAIDAAGPCALEFDQRGYARIDGACDSGAVEFDAVACSTCEAPGLLVGLLGDLQSVRSCQDAVCRDPEGLPPLDYLGTLETPAPGNGYYYREE